MSSLSSRTGSLAVPSCFLQPQVAGTLCQLLRTNRHTSNRPRRAAITRHTRRAGMGDVQPGAPGPVRSILLTDLLTDCLSARKAHLRICVSGIRPPANGLLTAPSALRSELDYAIAPAVGALRQPQWSCSLDGGGLEGSSNGASPQDAGD